MEGIAGQRGGHKFPVPLAGIIRVEWLCLIASTGTRGLWALRGP